MAKDQENSFRALLVGFYALNATLEAENILPRGSVAGFLRRFDAKGDQNLAEKIETMIATLDNLQALQENFGVKPRDSDVSAFADFMV